ncbi:hypothetical protein GNX18_14655 [Microbulbifer sp. SH-1]|uniref:hypothetical protein n=1 Tax=Microbulbifer sp. SH-1 TaxID=2681547 RepID=UPI001407F58C|nr:hypothetical protein [Microbulbifer sp. SH-1]QIL90873.1 hypothetical protein GNX18_14655 [Microbulbifer sp. SH-1]
MSQHNPANRSSITDEQLSAFLDRELPEAQMDQIRAQLTVDESLADRLAQLAAVDQAVNETYSSIDQRPMPGAVTDLLTQKQPASAEIVAFPLWRRAQQKTQQQLQRHTGMAAAVALAIGLGAGWLLPQPNAGGDQWQTVAASLERAPSGVSQELADGRTITPRLTFRNQQGDYCRQFQLRDGTRGSENIACRSDGGLWQLAASIQLEVVQAPGSYQTATGGSLLDSALDAMAAETLAPDQEQKLIGKGWNKSTVGPSTR